ncbi:MAG: acetyltransferase [Novosphingobium sp.]|nr:acetyltransferase [Novosphingobium sp.]
MLIGLYGSGGCGRGIMPLARERYGAENCVWIDDAAETPVLNGTRLLNLAAFIAEPGQEKAVCVTIANSKVREMLVNRCTEVGLGFESICAENAIVMDDVEIGEGAAISPFVTITSNIRIGRHFHANLYSCVEHDCVIGDFVTFAPGAKCNGNVHISDHAYIGSGAVIRQGNPGEPLVIGKGAVVGMGAVVTKDVPPDVTVAGNPARPLN